jgi:hypothetical protein
VVLLGPIEIDLARPHRLERALHPDGADDVETTMPTPRASQNTTFSPALNRRAGGCLDRMKPPPCLNHSKSISSGMLSLSQSAAIRTMPITNGSCAYLAQLGRSDEMQ